MGTQKANHYGENIACFWKRRKHEKTLTDSHQPHLDIVWYETEKQNLWQAFKFLLLYAIIIKKSAMTIDLAKHSGLTLIYCRALVLCCPTVWFIAGEGPTILFLLGNWLADSGRSFSAGEGCRNLWAKGCPSMASDFAVSIIVAVYNFSNIL